MTSTMYKKLKIEKVIDITDIVSVHYFEFAQGYIFSGESHNFWEIVYIDKGSAHIGAEQETHILNDGTMIFHQPNEFHSIYVPSSHAPNIAVIAFVCDSEDMRLFNGLITKLDLNQKRLLSMVISEAQKSYKPNPSQDNTFSKIETTLYGTKQNPNIGTTFTKIDNSPYGSQELFKNYLENLLISIIRTKNTTNEEIDTQPQRFNRPSAPIARDEYNHNLIYKIDIYLTENMHNKININDISKRFGISSSSLKRLFSETQHSGIIEHLNKLRLEKAKSLIRKGNLNMSQISLMTGFSSLHYFSKRFKLYTGMTPSEYAHSLLIEIFV